MTTSERQPPVRATPEGATVPPVAASTVILLRDGPADGEGPGPRELQVLLLERHLNSDFAGGALVFPGGKVDAADRSLAPERWAGRSLEQWTAHLGVERADEALGFLVAAIRETFEEAGVLLALRENGERISGEELKSRPFMEARERLADRGSRWDWRPWLEEQRVVLDLSALALWSWWVTPRGSHKRFDTRFLVARMPTDQSARFDNVETTSLRWLAPGAALDAAERGEATVIFPTRCNLRQLSAFADVEAAWQAAAEGRVDQRCIEPTLFRKDGKVYIQHPFEDGPEAL